MRPNYPGIYAIVCIANNKIYVGSAKDISQRWYTHQSMLRRHRTHSHKLQNAWDKYGEENFEFLVLERVDNLEDLIAREQYWIDLINPELNIRKIADRNDGVRMPREAVEKVAEINRLRERSPEEREKHRLNRLGMKFPEEWCKNISRGKSNPSPESRAKMSAAKKGILPVHAVEASRKVTKGKPRSAEVKAKIKETWAKRIAEGKVPQHERDSKGRFC